MNYSITMEFNQKVDGGLTTILRCKASQYRLMALYLGIVIFRDIKIVSREFYSNFLHFSVALRLLNSESKSLTCHKPEVCWKSLTMIPRKYLGVTFHVIMFIQLFTCLMITLNMATCLRFQLFTFKTTLVLILNEYE